MGSRLPAWQLARSSSSVAFRIMGGLRQIKPGILKITIRRGQSNFSIAFIFVSFEEKVYYFVHSVGQLSFDCRSCCGRRRRVQGMYKDGWKNFAHVIKVGLHIWQTLPKIPRGVFYYNCYYSFLWSGNSLEMYRSAKYQFIETIWYCLTLVL